MWNYSGVDGLAAGNGAKCAIDAPTLSPISIIPLQRRIENPHHLNLLEQFQEGCAAVFRPESRITKKIERLSGSN